MRKGKSEWLPWYRAPNYDGNLTETEKRQLDAFRAQPKHPATQKEDLPQEVQNYIGILEMDIYDYKQQEAAAILLFFCVIGASLFMLHYFNYFMIAYKPWIYAFDFLLVVTPWHFYKCRWEKNAEEFLPRDPDAPSPTDEALRKEWELEYLLAIDNRRPKRTSSLM